MQCDTGRTTEPGLQGGVGTATSIGSWSHQNAGTGEEIWQFDPDDKVAPGWGVNRGVLYWDDNENGRIIYTSGKYIYAVDAINGEIEKTFGENGKIDLRKNLGRPFETLIAKP